MRVEEGMIDSVLEAVTDTMADATAGWEAVLLFFFLLFSFIFFFLLFHFYREKREVPGCNGVQARIRRAHASRARGFSSQPLLPPFLTSTATASPLLSSPLFLATPPRSLRRVAA